MDYQWMEQIKVGDQVTIRFAHFGEVRSISAIVEKVSKTMITLSNGQAWSKKGYLKGEAQARSKSCYIRPFSEVVAPVQPVQASAQKISLKGVWLYD